MPKTPKPRTKATHASWLGIAPLVALSMGAGAMFLSNSNKGGNGNAVGMFARVTNNTYPPAKVAPSVQVAPPAQAAPAATRVFEFPTPTLSYMPLPKLAEPKIYHWEPAKSQISEWKPGDVPRWLADASSALPEINPDSFGLKQLVKFEEAKSKYIFKPNGFGS